MSRMPDAETPRLRFPLAVMVGGAASLLMPSLFAAPLDVPSTVLLATLVVAFAATVGFNHHVGTSVARALAPPLRAVGDAPIFLAGRVTDPVHHPIRPRAPGMA
jgi:hypothetical protein